MLFSPLFSFSAQAALLASLLLLAAPQSYLANASPAGSPARRATTCNGSPDLCSRSFGNTTFVGAHDSYAVGTSLAANQDYNITQQLNDGIRMLQVQAHNSTGDIFLCHTSCALYNGGPLSAYLETVKTWLDANPSEVLSILIVNSDHFGPSAYDAVYKATGLDTMSYAPPSASMSASKWPTLGNLIDSGKRLITFMDASADFESVSYIIDEFSSIWETAFDVTTSFDCSVNRTHGDPSTQMSVINHFFDTVTFGELVPDRAQANLTNAVSGQNSLGQQVNLCVADHGRNPNFLLVDFYEAGGGSVFQVAAAANGVTYSPTTPIAPIPQASTTGSGSSSGATATYVPRTTALVLVTSFTFAAFHLL